MRRPTAAGDRAHIVVLTMYYPPEVGAPQTRLAALVGAISERGHSVEVVTAMPNYPTGRVFAGYRHRPWRTEHDGAVTIRRVWAYAALGSGARRLLSYLSFTFSSLFGLIRCRRPLLVFVESPPLFLAVPGLLAAKLWRALAVFNVADLWPDAAVDLGALHPGHTLDAALALEHWAYRRADVVNVVTDSVGAVLRDDKHVPESKLARLPNGVDTELFAPGGAIGAGDVPDGQLRRTLVYAGTVGFIHAADRLVAAMAQLTDLDVRLRFYASGSALTGLRDSAAAAGLTTIEFREPVPPAELAPVLRGCLAGVVTLADVPMAEKTRPSKMFPTMASGRPVLYCGRGEGARLVAEHGAGVVVDNEPLAIAAAVRRLAADPAAATALGRNGRAFVEANLSWTAIIDNWLNEVLGRAR